MAEAQTILLVDDDELHLELYSRALKKAGFRPITTLVGRDTIGFFGQDESPALVLLDYRLNSALDSRQLATILRQRFPEAPIIVHSSSDVLPEDMREVASGFIQKSGPEQLVANIRRVLQSREVKKH